MTPDIDDAMEAFEERAAIMEYDGGMPREEAEAKAIEIVTGVPAGDGE